MTTRVACVTNRIMPSLLSADFANLQTSIETIPSADALHVDVMDYHFVPNLTLGLPVMEAIRRVTDKVLDLHLMISDPDRWAPTYAEQERIWSPSTSRPPTRRSGWPASPQSRGAGRDGAEAGNAYRAVRRAAAA